jgi:SagB-type dehydrogenase family enzyme
MTDKTQLNPTNRRSVLFSALAGVGGLALGWLAPRRLVSQAESSAEPVLLPTPTPDVGMLTLDQAIAARRSTRLFADEPLTSAELSHLLTAAQGITEKTLKHRAAPSASATYPIELYPVVHNVTGLSAGIYHYVAIDEELERVRLGNFREAIVEAGDGQAHLGESGVCFVFAAAFERTREVHGERGDRYVLLEAGHIGENICLTATALGLGVCTVGSFDDSAVNDLIGVDGVEQTAIYTITVGRRA